jgi:phage terminase small subunit
MARITIKDGKLRGLSPKKACFVIEYIKDFAARRAAEASGHAPDKGNELLKDPQIQEAIQSVLEYRLEEAGIDGAWILYELIDNHRIARQQGNISASNTALKILAQLALIDALAKQRVEVDVVSDKELMGRLQRGRTRLLTKLDEGGVSFF